MAEDETTVLPDLTPTRRIDLAWSAEEFRPYYLDYYPPAEPAPRTRVEVATAIWTLLALAIMYGCTSDTSYPRVMPASMAVPAAAAPSVATVEPTEATESVPQPDVWTLPPVPAAEHLALPPPRVDPNADAKYLTRMQQAGIIITSVPAAINTGHIICADMASGLSSEGEARLIMRDNPTMAHMYAIGWVYAAVDTYCPEYIGR